MVEGKDISNPFEGITRQTRCNKDTLSILFEVQETRRYSQERYSYVKIDKRHFIILVVHSRIMVNIRETVEQDIEPLASVLLIPLRLEAIDNDVVRISRCKEIHQRCSLYQSVRVVKDRQVLSHFRILPILFVLILLYAAVFHSCCVYHPDDG